MNAKYYCRYHPERHAVITCDKFEYGYCEQCLGDCQACTDTESYCKSRTHCVIWEHCRQVAREKRVGGG
jgi:hypothetical protein